MYIIVKGLFEVIDITIKDYLYNELLGGEKKYETMYYFVYTSEYMIDYFFLNVQWIAYGLLSLFVLMI